MNETLDQFPALDEIGPALRRAGLSGAGGGGFPTYVKWRSIGDVDYLLVNHQESEPNCYVDKWIGREYAEELATLFDFLLDTALDAVVIGAKQKNRDPWLRPLEAATDGSVCAPEDLPLDPDAASGVTFAYTENTYECGMENVLLQRTTGTILGKDLPVDYGWIVQNTETMYNIWRALAHEDPVLHTFVHVDGYLSDGRRVPNRMFQAPIGTSAAALFSAAGVDPDSLAADRRLVEGGPGWCFAVQRPADRYGVRKRTNCLMLLGQDHVADNTYGNGRIDVLDPLEWSLSDPDVEPTRIDPDRVHVPIVTNETYDDLIAASDPGVQFRETVSSGQVVADPIPEGEGFSVAHHAPISGEVSDVTPREIEIRRSGV
jgi:Na+-translocating ferredoxin:NAD+ oxidoreductase RnfC subunit